MDTHFGELESWNDDKGWGWIVQKGGEKEWRIFVHNKNINGNILIGDMVSFTISKGAYHHRDLIQSTTVNKVQPVQRQGYYAPIPHTIDNFASNPNFPPDLFNFVMTRMNAMEFEIVALKRKIAILEGPGV